jgi:hypothetical protein
MKVSVRCLVEQLYAIENASDILINEDFAVELMETVAAELQTMGSEDRSIFTQTLKDLAQTEVESCRKTFFEQFSENIGLSEFE